jgi:branched-chain amino acid aminotransferase
VTDVPAEPPLDRGLLLGDGLFETLRLYRGRPFRLDAHLARLRDGAGRVGIPVPPDLNPRVDEVVRRWAGEDGALRILLTRGVGSGLAPPSRPVPTLRVWAEPLAVDAGLLRRGLRAVVRGFVHERALTAGLKTTGYLERIQAVREGHAAGAHEALLRNSAGRVVEGSASNLFWTLGSALLTPSVDEGALPGITRAVVLEVAERLGIPVRSGSPTPGELEASEEVFLSSSLRELAPIVEIEGRPVGPGRPGPVFRAVREGFRDVVVRELDLPPPA